MVKNIDFEIKTKDFKKIRYVYKLKEKKNSKIVLL